MRKQSSNSTSDQSATDLLNHIKALGLCSIDEYRAWCDRHGFSRKLNKHWRLRSQECDVAKRQVAEQRLGQRRREQRSHADVLRTVCEKKVKAEDVTFPHLKRLCEVLGKDGSHSFEPRINRKSLLHLMSHLHDCRAKFFDGTPAVSALGQLPGNTYIEGLAIVAAHSDAWLRPVEDWKPRTHSSSRQFASLLRHLFVRYDDMPLFFDTVWFSASSRHAAQRRRWYLHVGLGHNVRTCDLPITLTKKMSHHFMQAPNDATIEQALRWGQVLGLGGDVRLARAIFGTRLTQSFDDDSFWCTVLQWFVANPMLDRAHVGPIVDYLHHQRFVPQHTILPGGLRETIAPAEPNLSMKGRTADGLLQRVHRWHQQLANDNRLQIRQWQSSGIKGYEFLEGSQDNGSLKFWTIRELLSSKALMTEGRQMKHCVATYASSCTQGHTSIWTMEVESVEGCSKAVTIEIRNSSRQICQVRGKANRLATDKERRIIQRWAESAGLRLASYV